MLSGIRSFPTSSSSSSSSSSFSEGPRRALTAFPDPIADYPEENVYINLSNSFPPLEEPPRDGILLPLPHEVPDELIFSYQWLFYPLADCVGVRTQHLDEDIYKGIRSLTRKNEKVL